MRVGRRVTFVCRWCGRTSTRYVRPSRPEPQFCGQRCRGLSFKGVRHTSAQIAARVKRGAAHPQWRGDAAVERSGRTRAERMFPSVGPCVRCGALRAERHHVDGNTLNNEPSNIEALCRRCHMVADGRIDAETGRITAIESRRKESR